MNTQSASKKNSGSKVTPPPPICTIPLPEAKPKSAAPAQARQAPQMRKLAVSTISTSERSRRMAGYPRRAAAGKTAISSQAILITMLGLAVLIMFVYVLAMASGLK